MSVFMIKLCAAFAIATLLKALLLAPGLYWSTDFEVHRNWLAITHSLPLGLWYYEDSSDWTLDYPPFFAWFEWGLSQAAAVVDPAMVMITARPYISVAALWFQKCSVMATDAALLVGVIACCTPHAGKAPGGQSGLVVGLLVFFNAGLLLVDHMHFQYNGMLLGLLLLSVGLMKQGREVTAGVVFACLLMLKHLFLALAPLYFVYLLRRYCMGVRPEGPPSVPSAGQFFCRLAGLGAAVAVVFVVALGPFCLQTSGPPCADQLAQIVRRLLPFDRGLVHAYWAPNVWALYLFADRVLVFLARRLQLGPALVGGVAPFPSSTAGLVQDIAPAVLPAVRPPLTAALTILAMAPSLYKAWTHPTPRVFCWGLVYCGLCSFMLGWHVHEKAVLVAILPLTLLAVQNKAAARLYIRTCALGHFGIFPLLAGPAETVTKLSLYSAHLILAYSLLSSATDPNCQRDMAGDSRSAQAHPPSAHYSPPVLRSQKSRAVAPAQRAAHGHAVGVHPADASSAAAKSQNIDWGHNFLTRLDLLGTFVLGCVFVFAEVLHPVVWRKADGSLGMPFLPQLMTSVVCAIGLLACWGMSGQQLWRSV